MNKLFISYMGSSAYLILILLVGCNVSQQKSQQLNCGDLLSEYAILPNDIQDKIHFEQCERVNTQMAIIKATYHVEADDVAFVEDYFATKYNMPKLHWIDKECYDGICIRGASSYGGVKFEPEKITDLYTLNKDYIMSYDLRGYYDIMRVPNHKKLDKNQITNYTLEISIAEQP